jgi:TRAP-type C4-dicarboxylate transport system permease small subunit
MHARLGKYLERSIEIALVLVSVFIVGMVTLDVVLRKVGTSTLVITEELCRYMMVWLVFVASSLAVRERSHIAILVLVGLMGTRVRRWVSIFADLVFLAFLTILSVYTIKLLPQQLSQTCITMDISMFYFYLAIPVGSGLMAFFLVRRIVSGLFGALRGL